ncbi:hypothetical protein HEB94_003784 [Actinopolymorpha pittospori]|uniref:Uncharacterized protein n=1 Tax=Actinopolymorpha pittospori TaxID=648752 RepID=A0A927MU46_9ACTN|nr:hypothetical protein [Actinopolymorpha pittospori]
MSGAADLRRVVRQDQGPRMFRDLGCGVTQGGHRVIIPGCFRGAHFGVTAGHIVGLAGSRASRLTRTCARNAGSLSKPSTASTPSTRPGPGVCQVTVADATVMPKPIASQFPANRRRCPTQTGRDLRRHHTPLPPQPRHRTAVRQTATSPCALRRPRTASNHGRSPGPSQNPQNHIPAAVPAGHQDASPPLLPQNPAQPRRNPASAATRRSPARLPATISAPQARPKARPRIRRAARNSATPEPAAAA